jgi:hypothetical protein
VGGFLLSMFKASNLRAAVDRFELVGPGTSHDSVPVKLLVSYIRKNKARTLKTSSLLQCLGTSVVPAQV